MSDDTEETTAAEAANEVGGVTRRTVLTTVAAGIGAAIAKGPAEAAGQSALPAEISAAERRIVSEVGQRSPFETPRRLVGNLLPGSVSKTPVQDLNGFITPSDLHYESHNSGIPNIDPDKYTLRVDGLVERPMTLTLKDLKQFPEQTLARYLECSGNGIRAFAGMVPELTPAEIDGMVSTSVWTGIFFSSLLEAVKPKAEATWFRAEGHDGDWDQPIPMDARWNDSLIAWGQNGEALRPEQGYPARLLLAGHPGPPNTKWLSRIEFMGGPMPEGVERSFGTRFGSKSIITYPVYPDVISEPGELVISGLAWSGRGKVARVDISTDGGQTWEPAELQQPALPYCQTRFRYRWSWDGGEALLMSRATDETGDVQISLEEAREARQANKEIRHYYANIRAWAVAADGVVTFGLNAT
jgi:sulfane dehydrogenase subunit SoxC